ncbi:helix-turn-helix transcriptional regulator [Streptomyces flavofungini]|uniref:helix-turn-helix transcriptional regulator n=1 Tax=Streptomyces flavofungini TaxID=68200 RepID=UPI0025AFB773|nr:LuxR family transcriptional regulator [Streptomyces flavofungini]WJV45427.1 LuxR C-terminal-related transcriptional regulator [Streptomyces flavofungini]
MSAADGGEAADVRAALLRLRRGTGLPVAFGGLVTGADGTARVRIAELSGTATHSLNGLAIHVGNGLGGKAVALARPCAVTDYSTSRQISHEYDTAVALEGLRAVLAVPLVVRRRVRGLLYGALRTAQPLGDRALAAAVAAARDLEQALVVRDEAAAMLAAAREAAREAVTERSARGYGSGDAAWERVREAHGALRALAPRIGDPALREELLAVCGTLTDAAPGSPGPAPDPGVRLAPRELDVLACVAGGVTNAAAAERLGLRPETVKGYLRSAMRKLGAHTRWEAVVAARRAGVLP